MNTNSTIRARRIADDIDALAGITEPDRPYTRRAFTPKFLEGRKWLEQAMRDAGAVTQIDAAGNLIGTIPGAHPDLGTIMLGSHSDTVPDGGRFDGIAGVIAALEVVRALRDQGTVLDHTLEVADFLAEEVSIFGVSCIGSRGMTGSRPPEWLQRVAGGLTLKQAIADVGGHPLHSAERDDIKAFLELHIEQGPVLQNEKIDIGVVTAIAGITRIEIIVEGRADHAGTTPMGARADHRSLDRIGCRGTRQGAGQWRSPFRRDGRRIRNDPQRGQCRARQGAHADRCACRTARGYGALR